MVPSFMVNNSRNLVLANVKHFSYLSLVKFFCGIKTPYFLNVFFAQFAQSVLRSYGVSSFSFCVSVICKRITKPKVVWVYTRWIVSTWAVMANKCSFFKVAVVNQPRSRMCRKFNVGTSSRSNPSISSPIFRGIPYPAGVSFSNFFPKPFDKCFGALSLRKKWVWMKWKLFVNALGSGIFDLHSKFSLLCHALENANSAGALSQCNINALACNV